MTRCHNYQGVHIPGCWGCAIYGGEKHDSWRCTCPRPERATRPDPETLILAALERIEERLAALTQCLERNRQTPLGLSA